jgi:16S rRNA C967 or C1407 C5-methylase (RsmB/RsmF family)
VSIRLNTKKIQPTPENEKIPWTTSGIYLKERPSFTLDPKFHGGAYYVQEASSMFLEQAVRQSVDLNSDLRVLDLCAAPGGKSTHLLSLISEASLLVSNEVIRSRSTILAENISKWGNHNITVTNSDPEHFGSLRNFFDLLVVDAPCSGEGLFRKDNDAMDEWSIDNVALCASRQKRILHDVWPSLKPEGILIYCTCTFNSLENEDNLVWLQQQHDIEFIKLQIDDFPGVETIEKGTTIGYRFFPHRIKGEGFFISVIRKLGSSPDARARSGKKIFSIPPKGLQEKLSSWINGPSEKSFYQFGERLLFLPPSQVNTIEFLSNNLHVVETGTALAVAKHEKLIPEHPSALSIHLNKGHFQRLDVSKEDAIRYLRKENLSFPDAARGFSLVCYDGLPIGWVNVLDNRSNNLYPANWRIRMTS